MGFNEFLIFLVFFCVGYLVGKFLNYLTRKRKGDKDGTS